MTSFFQDVLLETSLAEHLQHYSTFVQNTAPCTVYKHAEVHAHNQYLFINHINGTSQLRREKATGKKGPATALKLGTYALSRSFSHASHGDWPRSFVPHRPYVYSLHNQYLYCCHCYHKQQVSTELQVLHTVF